MRHIDYVEQITVGRDQYIVPQRIIDEVEALLKKAKMKTVEEMDEDDWIPAHVAIPDLRDPVKGPAKYLRGIRMREGLTQTQLAEKMGIKQSHISEMERFKRPIGKAMAKKFAKVLNANWQCFLA